MAIFSIGDLHLPLGIDKPMNKFGRQWDNYVERIASQWQHLITTDDVVVLPGDFSWATYIEQAERDFDFLEKLNGKKILVKGNHDYWWTTHNKMNEFLNFHNFSSISILQNNSFEHNGISICGTRGWIYPAWDTFDKDDEKYYNREVGRLELSLKSASTNEIYVFTHYPPMSQKCESNAFIELMHKYNVKKCIYGHLHGYSHQNRIPDNVNGIEYILTSSDFLKFLPKYIGGAENEINDSI